MRLDEVPPDPGLLRFWGSRDEVEAQARSRRRRPRLRCGAGSGELRARFPECESQAHPLFRRGCVTTISREFVRGRKRLRAVECFQLKGESSRGNFSRVRRRHICQGFPWGDGAPNLGFGSYLEQSVWRRRRAGAAD